MEKDPHYRADFGVNLCKMILSGKFWQYNPMHFMLYISESWQEEKRVPVAISKVKWSAQMGLTAFGPLIKSVWEVLWRDLTRGCAPSSPLRAPICTVAHVLHPDCTEMDVLGRGDQASA